ncbi:MAG: CNNM domain-containing protein, partial [Gemmatimonadota bacterium]
MSVELVLRLLSAILLVGANAFFVAVEFALTRLTQFSPEDIPEDDKGLQTAWKMTERLEIHLTGCQLGISATS